MCVYMYILMHTCMCMHICAYSCCTNIHTYLHCMYEYSDTYMHRNVHTTQFSYRNSKIFVGSSLNEIQPGRHRKSLPQLCLSNQLISPLSQPPGICGNSACHWHSSGAPGRSPLVASEHQLLACKGPVAYFFWGCPACKAASLRPQFESCSAHALLEWCPFRGPSSHSCAFRAKDEIDSSFPQAPTCTCTLTVRHAYQHKFARASAHTHTRIYFWQGCLSKYFRESTPLHTHLHDGGPKKEKVTREGMAWPLPQQANTQLPPANFPHMPP